MFRIMHKISNKNNMHDFRSSSTSWIGKKVTINESRYIVFTIIKSSYLVSQFTYTPTINTILLIKVYTFTIVGERSFSETPVLSYLHDSAYNHNRLT